MEKKSEAGEEWVAVMDRRVRYFKVHQGERYSCWSSEENVRLGRKISKETSARRSQLRVTLIKCYSGKLGEMYKNVASSLKCEERGALSKKENGWLMRKLSGAISFF